MSLNRTIRTEPHANNTRWTRVAVAAAIVLIIHISCHDLVAQGNQPPFRFALETSTFSNDTLTVYSDTEHAPNSISHKELVAKLAEGHNLHWIDFVRCDLRNAIDILRDITTTDKIAVSYYDCKIGSESLRVHTRTLNIYSLLFCDCVFVDSKPLPLSKDELRHLYIHDCNIEKLSDLRLSTLSTCTQLIHLSLRGIHADTLLPIAAAASLRTIEFDQCEVDDKTIRELHARKVESLRFDRCKLTDEQLNSVAHLGTTKQLHLLGIPISASFLEALCRNKQLHGLYLSGCPLEEEHVKAIATIPQLECLRMHNCGLNDKTIAFANSLQSLIHLDINFNPNVGDDGIRSLSQLQGLKRLCVIETGLTDRGILELARASGVRMICCSKITISQDIHELLVDQLGPNSACVIRE